MFEVSKAHRLKFAQQVLRGVTWHLNEMWILGVIGDAEYQHGMEIAKRVFTGLLENTAE